MYYILDLTQTRGVAWRDAFADSALIHELGAPHAISGTDIIFVHLSNLRLARPPTDNVNILGFLNALIAYVEAGNACPLFVMYSGDGIEEAEGGDLISDCRSFLFLNQYDLTMINFLRNPISQDPPRDWLVETINEYLGI